MAAKRSGEQAGRAATTRESSRRRAANQRADAQRNRSAILAAVPTALRVNPHASVSEIATEAGVGRMTLYGHFATRADLLDAALTDTLERSEAVLSQVPLDTDASKALSDLITSSWTLLDQARALLAAAQSELPPGRIRDLHEKAEARMRGLLERGRREGRFRTDLPVDWMLAMTHAAMNAAAEEVTANRLDASDAPRFIDQTLQPAFAADAATC